MAYLSSTLCNYKLLAEPQVVAKAAKRISKAMRPHQMLNAECCRCKQMWAGSEAGNSLIAV